MYKILVVAGRDTIRFNQAIQIEEMRFDTLEFARKAVEVLSTIFTDCTFELLDLEEYTKLQEENRDEMIFGVSGD